jgi:uncharacterized protein YecT (DUF1311 family)
MSRLIVLLPVLALIVPHPAAAAEPDDVKAIKACVANASDSPQRSCIGRISNACQEEPNGSTTAGMDDCISREAEAWDRILNDSYKAETASAKSLDTERKAGGDETSTAAADLLKAQRAWIAYRDAECDRRFEVNKDGTIRTTMSLSCTLDLTALRALDLQPSE